MYIFYRFSVSVDAEKYLYKIYTYLSGFSVLEHKQPDGA